VIRLLLDENVSPALAAALPTHDAVHVNTVGLNGAPDAVIMLWAATQRRVVVTHDHDFVDNLWTLGARSPSVIKLTQRGPDGLVGMAQHAEHLGVILPSLERRLRAGCVVVANARGFVAEPLPIAHRLERTRGR
jgi:predicted nuclease of predicted toxin-antitoxin system